MQHDELGHRSGCDASAATGKRTGDGTLASDHA